MGYSIRNIIIAAVLVFLAVISVVFVASHLPHKSAGTATLPKLVHATDFIDKSGSSVVWTQEGRLLGDDRRRAVRITVSPTERRVELLEGYNESVAKTVILSNNDTAYGDFLRALDIVRFGQERKVKQADERGVCPLGSRYIYEINDVTDQKLRLWSDSCVSSDGTFGGNAGTVRELFKNQITDYDKFVSGVQF